MTRPVFDTDWILGLLDSHLYPANRIIHANTETSPQADAFLCMVGFDTDHPAGTFHPGSHSLILHTGKASPEDLSSDELAKTYGKLIRHALDNYQALAIRVNLPPCEPHHTTDAARGIMTARLQAGFMKTRHSSDYCAGPGIIDICPDRDLSVEDRAIFEDAVDKGLELGGLANVQRILGALPGNTLSNETYPTVVRTLCKEIGIEVFEPEHEAYEKMDLLHGVNAGSSHHASVLALHVKATRALNKTTSVIVGKGVTFDTGGLNIKTGDHMSEMQADMMGSAAALTTALYFAKHPDELERDLVCVLGIVENRVDAKSYCAEDVLVAYDGRTVQIANTDAEGRLVLADCCAWICDYLGADNIESLTTIATLTGHAHRATGNGTSVAIVRGNDVGVLTGIEGMSRACGDLFQRMHIEPCDHAAMVSPVADLTNLSGAPERGAMTGAAFVQTFVPAEVPHVIHLDIARATSRKGNKGLVDGIPQYAGPLLLIELHKRME